MPNYKEMLRHLYLELVRAVKILQEAQRQTEEIYVADKIADLIQVVSAELTEDEETPPPQDE